MSWIKQIAMRSFTAADLNKQVGEVTDAALRASVIMTRRAKPKFVLMSMEPYEALRGPDDPRRAFTIAEMPEDIAAGLLLVAEAYEREYGGDD